MVTVGIGNMMKISDAANVIGCSISNVNALVNRKKIKAQKFSGTWMLDYDEVYKYKEHYKPRSPRVKHFKTIEIEKAPVSTLQYDFDKRKIEFLNIMCEVNGTTLKQYILDHLDKLYEESVKGLKFESKTVDRNFKKSKSK